MQIDTKKITPGWIKLVFGVIIAAVLTYQAVGVSTETNEKQDKQLYYLQGSAKSQDTEIALMKQRADAQERDLREFKEKMDAQTIRAEQVNAENNKKLTEIQSSLSRLDAGLQIYMQEKLKGR
ncbi:hypothetical protein [Aeromonas salmonicida]|uniref:hypothetical protein n=1 Tax=Aeromonas salmonicida TaxID=645 RepID=UPI003D3144C0